MTIAIVFWKLDGLEEDAIETRELSRRMKEIGMSSSSSEAIHAKRTADSESHEEHCSQASEPSSSALLMNFARDLYSERTQANSGPMLPGLGGDLETSCAEWAIASSHSDSGRVVLALTTGGSGCSCSPRFPTPTASTHNKPRDREKLLERRRETKERVGNGNGFGLNLGQFCLVHGIEMTLELYESLMGFPENWSMQT